MVSGKPSVDPIAAYDPVTCKCVLAEWYKHSIIRVVPKGVKTTAAFWLLLTDIVSKFQLMKKCRAARRPPAVEIKRWERIGKLASKVMQNDTSLHVQELAKNQMEIYGAFRGDFKRKANRNNEVLYGWILEDVWCRTLGQDLGVSINEKVPGPLIKFFSACVDPLLSKPLTANAIIAIRNRVREKGEQRAKARKGKMAL